jgi:hypothetical protein
MKKNILVLMLILFSSSLLATPITYYDLDFEDGSLGGGSSILGFSDATNIAGSNLDGNALLFDLDDQLQWGLNGSDSLFHYVAFDFFANPGSKVTQFLDIPNILRTDVVATGRHRMEILYDFVGKTVEVYFDGLLDNSLLTAEFWPANPASSGIRIANQTGSPGNSTGTFQIDNLVWMGDDSAFTVNKVSAPSTLLLLSFMSMLVFRISRKC